MSFGVPSGFFGTILFSAGCIPFIIDAGVNLYTLTGVSNQREKKIRDDGY